MRALRGPVFLRPHPAGLRRLWYSSLARAVGQGEGLGYIMGRIGPRRSWHGLYEVRSPSPAAFDQFMAAERKKYQQVVKASGAKVD